MDTVGLLPVIGVEASAFHRGHPGAGWIAGGHHVDIAHLLMGVSFWLMVRGCRPYVIDPRE